jgi:hypothetical protein
MKYDSRYVTPIVRFLTKENLHEDMYSVVSVETQTNIRSVGTFAVSLVATPKPGSRYSSSDLQMFFYEQLEPMDVVEIGFKQEGKETKVFTGLVDRCTKAVSISGNRIDAGVTISGRDFQKIFMEASVLYYPELDTEIDKYKDTPIGPMLEQLRLGLTLLDEHRTWLNADIRTGYEFILEKLCAGFRTGVVCKLDKETGEPVKRRIRDFVDTKTGICPDPDDIIMSANEELRGKVWDLLRAVLGGNYFFYELFIVTISGKDPAATLILRKKPFDPEDWFSLATWDDPDSKHQTLDKADVKQIDLGRSDLDTATVFRMQPANTMVENVADFVVAPEMLVEAMDTYGVRALHVTTTLEKRNTITPESLKILQQNLKDWYQFNPWFEAGMVTVKGNPSIKVGEKAFLPFNRIRWADGKIYPESMFYIEGVRHRWRIGTAFETSVKLTRGQPAFKSI